MFQSESRAGGRSRGTRNGSGPGPGSVIPTAKETRGESKTVRRRKSFGVGGFGTGPDGSLPGRNRAFADVTNQVTDRERPRRGPRKGKVASLKADLFEDLVDQGVALVEREIISWTTLRKEKTA
jgi:hypothetical protein